MASSIWLVAVSGVSKKATQTVARQVALLWRPSISIVVSLVVSDELTKSSHLVDFLDTEYIPTSDINRRLTKHLRTLELLFYKIAQEYNVDIPTSSISANFEHADDSKATSIGKVLCQQIEMFSPQLVIMGSTRVMHSCALGSTSKFALGHAKCPVMIVTGKTHIPSTRPSLGRSWIVLVDFRVIDSNGNEDLFKLFQGPDSIHFAHACGHSTNLASACCDKLETLKELTTKRIQGCTASCGIVHVSSFHATKSEIANKLCEVAAEGSYSALCMGSRKHKLISEKITGRVTKKIMKRTALPCVIIPSHHL